MRAGSVLLHNELGVQQANVGDVITLGSNAMFGYEPEGFVTVTTICLDLDYVIDQGLLMVWLTRVSLRRECDATYINNFKLNRCEFP